MRAWLFKIARNRHIDGVRREQSAPDRFSFIVPTEQQEPAATELSPSFALDIGNAVKLLDPDLQEVLWLLALQQLSYEEAASVLAVPVGTVRSRLFRARREMREILRDYWRHGAENVNE